jgi:hypothetical protein
MTLFDAARFDKGVFGKGVLLVGACLLLLGMSGCRTAQSYAGERRSKDEVARITGDTPINGAPLAVILRKVDRRELGFSESSVEVLPGKHALLVDCRIRETSSTTRHTLDVDVEAGGRYRLTADAAKGMRGCVDVRIEAQ